MDYLCQTGSITQTLKIPL